MNEGAAEGVASPRWLILLVDDLLDARELYAQYLTYAGFSVVTAINGHEAVRLAELLHPDLILMDIRLPGMDGLEATSDLKANPAVADIPVVAITADESEEVRERAQRVGCSAFISKPALPDAVARSIVAILSGEQRLDSSTDGG
ncbi:MAG: hypothetical protein A3H96_21040 [Acidobacteria bacterium RIFCSPLOWO2_02_FULL_67_36]|nr:MAG: hypothetical protein A3H96_21040 [Acidobacteria bacterium RIFCSPLOWO2_02_FULL_67_36]OFW21973.1 MAG: hypothetical protein A3G21_08610 [Acidobacteria bacterium RIFCSPLOWO2_12_FULL_66_21]